MHGVIGAGVILSVMGGGVFTNVLAAPNAWPTEVLAPLFVCAGTEWLVPKSPVAFHSLGLLPVCIPFHSSRSLVWGGVFLLLHIPYASACVGWITLPVRGWSLRGHDCPRSCRLVQPLFRLG